MATEKLTIVPAADPTLPVTDIVINGKTYRMCFDLGSLALVEDELRAKGENVNLFAALPVMTLANVRIVFAASLRKLQPEIGYEDALNLLTLPYLHEAGMAIASAWNQTLSPPIEGEENADPTTPGQ